MAAPGTSLRRWYQAVLSFPTTTLQPGCWRRGVISWWRHSRMTWLVDVLGHVTRRSRLLSGVGVVFMLISWTCLKMVRTCGKFSVDFFRALSLFQAKIVLVYCNVHVLVQFCPHLSRLEIAHQCIIHFSPPFPVPFPVPKANSAFHPSGVGKWVPALAGKAKAGMVHSVSRCTRGVQVKLWDPLRTRALEVCSRRGAIQIHVYLTLPCCCLAVWCHSSPFGNIIAPAPP